MDVTKIKSELSYSMHTENSYVKRKLNSRLLATFHIREKWAEEFAVFFFTLTKGKPNPKVTEIHHPLPTIRISDNLNSVAK